tara:strand:+ start:1008 stop:1325 length:318 start_codon:yes stop_codon:yes gene_type:complete
MTNMSIPIRQVFRGEFKATSSTGQAFSYALGDVVIFEGKAFIASQAISGLSPDLSPNWIPWGSSRVSFRSTKPKNAYVGDEWINAETGKKYCYIDDGDTKQWVEL